MTKKYLLDANVISTILRSPKGSEIKQSVSRRILDRHEVHVSCLAHFELRRGLFEISKDRDFVTERIKRLDAFCDEYGYAYLDNREIIVYASKLWADLRQETHVQFPGKLDDTDLLMAATAIITRSIMVSRDQAFARIANLNLPYWELEEW